MDAALRQQLRPLGEVCAVRPQAGGDFATAYVVDLVSGERIFVKTHVDPPVGHFSTEAAGLRWLAETGCVPVPEVLLVSDEAPACLALEWVDGGGQPSGAQEAAFGRALAALHGVGAPVFGRTDARSTGSLGLPNEPVSAWNSFYAEQRLLPLARLAADRRALSPQVIRALEATAATLPDFGAGEEAPARLHGDLWAGNRLVDRNGVSWLIDPAAHGGHREFDLAMMRLFGGFGPDVFAAYAEVSPLADGWQSRVDLHQLAPLVVHAIKFGGSYRSAVEAALHRLGAW